MSKLTRQLSCFVQFFPDFVVFQDLYSGRVKEIGRENEELYVLRGNSCGDGLAKGIKVVHTIESERRDNLWHMRLGHPSLSTMNSIVKLHDSVNTRVQNNCHICPLAKQTRLQLPLSSSRAEAHFHIVHMDLWGPYKVTTFDKKYYFLTIVDDHSKYTCIYLLQLKCEVIVVLK